MSSPAKRRLDSNSLRDDGIASHRCMQVKSFHLHVIMHGSEARSMCRSSTATLEYAPNIPESLGEAILHSMQTNGKNRWTLCTWYVEGLREARAG